MSLVSIKYVKLLSEMLNAIEFLLYLFFAIVWYQTIQFVAIKKQSKLTTNNEVLMKYNNVLNEYYYNECSYKGGDYGYDSYSYEGLWVNNVENGFNIIRNKNITISGYKKDNVYDGLVRIDGTLLGDNNVNSVDCIYENGVQKTCFVINKNKSIKFIIPENVVVAI